MIKGLTDTRDLRSQSDYPISASNTNAIYRGDPVKFTSGYIVRCAANEPIFGIFMGCEYYDPAAKKMRASPYWPGATGMQNIKANVLRDPHVTYMAVWSGSVPEQTDVGAPIDIIYAAGSAVTGDSGVTIGAAVGGGGGQLFVMNLVDMMVDGSANSLAHATPVFEVAIRTPQINA